jgi:hypothetical protein
MNKLLLTAAALLFIGAGCTTSSAPTPSASNAPDAYAPVSQSVTPVPPAPPVTVPASTTSSSTPTKPLAMTRVHLKTYLGGIFYSISVLPPFWQMISRANPILYMINGFRYGFLGITDVSIMLSLGVLLAFIAILLGVTIYLFEKGYALRS